LRSRSGDSPPRRGRARSGYARLAPLLVALAFSLLLAPLVEPVVGEPVAEPRPAFAAEVTFGPIEVSNVDDQSFAISWTTDQVIDGYVRYGTDPSQPDAWTRVDDVRGANYLGYTHYVSVDKGDPGPVEPGTVYYFTVSSGTTMLSASASGRLTVTAGSVIAVSPPAPNFFSGIVQDRDGRLAAGVLVLVRLQRAAAGGSTEVSQPLSGLTDNSGAFSVDVSRARISRGQGVVEYFQLSTTSTDEKVSYELDAGRGNRASGAIDANATSAGSAAPSQPRIIRLPAAVSSAPVQTGSPTTGPVVATPPPVAPTVSPEATAARPSPSPSPTRPAPASPTVAASPPPGTPQPTPSATPEVVPTGSPAVVSDATPAAPASPTPTASPAVEGPRVPPTILVVIGAAILLVTVGLALAAVGFVEASRRR
jgi:hypothetical protein